MSLAALQQAAELLERAREIIEWHCPPSEAKLIWLRDLNEFDKGGRNVRFEKDV